MVLTDPVLISSVAALAILAGFAICAARRAVKRIETRFPPRADFITIDGTRLHVRRTGPTDGSAVLVLHGAASNLEEPYLALADSLADQSVIWLDRPGLGWSERPAGPWSPQTEAALIARLLETLDCGPVTVIGHSWGGAIAMRLAMDHPAQVKGLVLIAPALSAWIGDAAWFNAASFWPVLGPLITHVIVPLTGEAQARRGVASAFHPEPVPEAYVERSALPLLLRPRTWRANSRDMMRVNFHLEAQEDRYEDIDQPTEILLARADTVLWSHRHGGMVAERMPRARAHWISGAGHNLHHHHPERVAKAVADIRQRAAYLSGKAAMTGPAA
ncbi:alpha/beta fold hydrolase [Maricaulis sp. W15]|uniref:alpha/beta fold hydrolase n=1 Tax=Maricaulis sp. W15 TaxID=1772333 RepID=UPI000B1D3FDF|nr:alpha/beta hydrolase [Maricaulis sp. W15]